MGVDIGYAVEEDFNIDYLIDTTINGKGDTDSHLMTLFSIALSIKAKTIIELGVRKGYTTVPLLLAAQKNNGKLYSIDIKPIEFEVPKNLKQYWEFHKTDAIKFLTTWNKPIDLIYVDDLHTYDHVAKELKLIQSHITPSSIILLHDLMYGNWEPRYHTDMTLVKGQWARGGPYRAVGELDPQYWEFSTIPSCNGLTILRNKGTILPKK